MLCHFVNTSRKIEKLASQAKALDCVCWVAVRSSSTKPKQQQRRDDRSGCRVGSVGAVYYNSPSVKPDYRMYVLESTPTAQASIKHPTLAAVLGW